VLCGREGNRRSDVSPNMRHRLRGTMAYTGSVAKRREIPPTLL